MALRLAIFASGRGSNLLAIYNAVRRHELSGIELVLVLSNNSKSEALAFAFENNISAVHCSQISVGGDAQQYEQTLLTILSEHRIDLIALAGYMKKIPKVVITAYEGKVLNVHPSLLPEFGGEGMFGLNVHRAVLHSGQSVSGMTIHFVENDYDAGKIILQERCPVFPEDTPETLSKRVLALEHHGYPKALQIVANQIEQSHSQESNGASR